MSNSSSSTQDGLPVDLELASKTLSHGERVVLQVIEAQYDGSKPQVLKMFRSSDDISEGVRSQLPPHVSGTARIFDLTAYSDFDITGLSDTKGLETTRPARDALVDVLRETYGCTQSFDGRRIFRWLNDPLLVNDIGSISSQWSQSLGGRDNTNLYRLVNRSSLQQDPLDYDLHPRDSYLTCIQDANSDRLIVIIVNDVCSEQTFHMNKSCYSDIPFQNPRSISSILSGAGWTSFSDGSLDTFAKLLILDFFHSSIYLQRVDYYGSLIYPNLPEKEVPKLSHTRNPHLRVPLGLFESRLSAKGREAFKEIGDAEGILRSVNNLVDSINFVVAALGPNNTNTAVTRNPLREDYERRIHELKGLCSERRSNTQAALGALSRQLDYLTKRHTIREAKAIKILTILASVYLPLSLSASLLSMQSPFRQIAYTRTETPRDLVGTNLLFDFFSVFACLAASTIFILHAIRFGFWLKANELIYCPILGKLFDMCLASL